MVRRNKVLQSCNSTPSRITLNHIKQGGPDQVFTTRSNPPRFGGGEGSRTPVRNHILQRFYGCIPQFNIPDAHLPRARFTLPYPLITLNNVEGHTSARSSSPWSEECPFLKQGYHCNSFNVYWILPYLKFISESSRIKS